MPNLVTNIQGYSIHDGPGIRTVVFMKGCGLECQWCSNPECISSQAEIGLIKNLCTKCGKCTEACPNNALSCVENNIPHIDRTRCTGCGACSLACSYKALVLYGKSMTAEEIFDAVKRDKMFYDASGGGVTVSGGEALLQPELVYELFKKCREAGIHTCIETAGFAAEKNLRKVLPVSDYVLYDLKLMDPEKHLMYTGQLNGLILSNAKTVIESGVEAKFRMPLIPGINNDEKNILETAQFLQQLGEKALKIELMPYHRLGKGKYESLGKRYPLPEIVTPAPEDIKRAQQLFEDKDIVCTVSL